MKEKEKVTKAAVEDREEKLREKDTERIRDVLLRAIEEEFGLKSAATARIDGINFSAADIALPRGDGKLTAYRIAVIRNGSVD